MRKLSILFIIMSLLVVSLSGCGESSEAKSQRLKKEAEAAQQKATEAREQYKQLEKNIKIIENYQNSGY